MTLIVSYPTKKDLKSAVGKPLLYVETSLFGPEYKDTGRLVVTNRPRITRVGKREFFAVVEMKDGKIVKVE